MNEKVSIEFTNKELNVICNSLISEMNRSFKDQMCYIDFKILEYWYLLLKKINKAQKYYEQKTSEKAPNKSN